MAKITTDSKIQGPPKKLDSLAVLSNINLEY